MEDFEEPERAVERSRIIVGGNPMKWDQITLKWADMALRAGGGAQAVYGRHAHGTESAQNGLANS